VAIVSRPDDAMRAAGALLVVPDALVALEQMGRAARERVAGKVIAVTGSVGKTTTKDALKVALSACGATHAAVSSFNNHWGVPLTLARMPRDTAYGVIEVGMNHAGEIETLIDMVRPHVAIITAIAESHLGHFNHLGEIADAKAEIFTGVVPGGIAIINQRQRVLRSPCDKGQGLRHQ
jgi:UDP-N-acetylmuramoyl-tripeptide--D-alanyl-D-alanine ligase